MHQPQRTLALELLNEQGVDAALFALPASVTWLTGFAPPVNLGPHPFAGGPPLLWVENGFFTLVVVDAFSEVASGFTEDDGARVLPYTGYTYNAPLEGPRHMLEVVERMWANPMARRIGIELNSIPSTIMGALWKSHGTPEIVPIDGLLAPWRAFKTGEEMEKLRAAFQLADVGHQAARRAVQPGVREIDVWAAVEGAVQQAAGRRLPLGNDCIVGTRPWNIGGWPLDHPIRAADSVIVDLSPIVDGYWSDSCATYVAGGTPTDQQRELHAVASEVLALGVSMLHPGTIAGDIDEAMRQAVRTAGFPGYPHHTGHGVGVTGHEAPRIIPGSEDVLEAGMVVMLEPGIYLPGRTGVRLEDGFLITEDGPEQLTGHNKELT